MADGSSSEPKVDNTSIITLFAQLPLDKQEELNTKVEAVAEKEGRII